MSDGATEVERETVGIRERVGVESAEEVGTEVNTNDPGMDGEDGVNVIGAGEKGTDVETNVNGTASVGSIEDEETGEPVVSDVSVIRAKIGETHRLEKVEGSSMHVHRICHQPRVATSCCMMPSSLFSASVASFAFVGRLSDICMEYL